MANEPIISWNAPGHIHNHKSQDWYWSVGIITVALAPLTIGLLLATGWVLTLPSLQRPWALLLVPATIVFMMKTKLSPLWMIAAGAVVGALGGA